ncbi:MAG: hypothetical protein GXP38_04455 [Chloroflexi bacterium]|nr:hypothetical protein [Chloroflexota bacterium]
MPSRSEILTRIRQAQASAYLPATTPETPPPPVPPPFAAPLDEVFAEALIAVQGEVTRLKSRESARDWLLTEFKNKGVQKILGWEPDSLPIPDLANFLRNHGIQLIPSRLTEPDRQTSLTKLEPITVGLSGVDAALARTGSIVLHAKAEQGRLASLLPTVHYALLPRDRIYPDLAAWLAAPGTTERIRQSSNTVVITGPSRSADIAQTLTLGAHGPKTLHVLLIPA